LSGIAEVFSSQSRLSALRFFIIYRVRLTLQKRKTPTFIEEYQINIDYIGTNKTLFKRRDDAMAKQKSTLNAPKAQNADFYREIPNQY
jgi:hypothetical protein